MNPEDNKVTGEKSLITSEEVATVVSGNEQALIEQLERAKQVTLKQLEASKNAVNNVTANRTVPQKTQQELEEELRKREAELNAAKIAAGMQLSPSEQKEYNSNLNKQQVEMSLKQAQVEADIKSRVTPINQVRHFQTTELNPEIVANQNVSETNTQNVTPKQLTKKELKEQKKLQKQKEKEQQALAKKQKESEVLANKNIELEQKRKEKEERRANSNSKYILTIILFIGLFALVYFLPNITNYISAEKAKRLASQQAIITSGNLECVLTNFSEKFDYEYSSVFAFKDSKLIKLTYTSTIKGDKALDELELNTMKSECDSLKQQVSSLEGIIVRCSLSNGVMINEQVLNYEYIDKEKITTSYLEAGGTYPDYQYQENIDKIEKEMKAAGYTCERTR